MFDLFFFNPGEEILASNKACNIYIVLNNSTIVIYVLRILKNIYSNVYLILTSQRSHLLFIDISK